MLSVFTKCWSYIYLHPKIKHFFLLDPTRKIIKEGELPKLNLPVKSIVSSIAQSRRSYSPIEKREECTKQVVPVVSKRIVHSCFQSLVERSLLLKAVGWNITNSIGHVKLEKDDAFTSMFGLHLYVFFVVVFLCIFLQGRWQPTQSQLIQVCIVNWADIYDTHKIEHRTEPDSHKVSADN